MATIEISKDKRGEFRFRVKARNGEVIASSEGYKKKAKALAAMKSLKTAVNGKVVDLTALPAKPKQPAKKKASAGKAAKASKTSGKGRATKAGSNKASKSSAKSAAVKVASKANLKSKETTKDKPKSKPVAPKATARKPAPSVSKKSPVAASTKAVVATIDEPRLFSPASPSPRLLSETGADLSDDAEVEAIDEVEDPEQVAIEPMDDDISIHDDDAVD